MTTIALASASNADAEALPASPLVLLRSGGARPPLYFPPSILGENSAYTALIEALSPEQPVYAMVGRYRDKPPADTIEAIAQQLCARLMAAQPDGPVCLAGYSFAGLLAYEMARQLTEQGRDVAFLGLLDAGPDSTGPLSIRDAIMGPLYFLRNVPYWLLDEIRRLPAADRLAEWRRSARRLLRRVGAVASGRNGQIAATDVVIAPGWPDTLRALVQDNLTAVGSYRFPPYDGDLVVFRARTRPLYHSLLPDLGWSRCVRGRIRVVNLPANHQSLMRPPAINHLAVAFRRALDEAQR